MPFGLDENRYVPVFAGAATARFRRCFRAQPVQLYARHTKIWISQGADRISTASGSKRPLAKIPLATARGTDSSPQSISWYAQHIERSRRFRRPITGRVSLGIHLLWELTPASHIVECSSPDLTYPDHRR